MKYRNYYCTPKFSDGEKMYFGDVQGTPEIPMIEAENLDDFERLFKQAVDDYISNGKRAKPKKRLGWIIALAVIIALLGMAVVTCPDKQAHKDAILAVINEKLNENIQKNTKDGDDGLAILGASIGTSLTGWILDSGLSVDNRFIYSVGKFNTGKEIKQVSVGVFGHVFTFSKKDVDKVLKELTE
ncbi:MAG: hypothetical protein IKW89_03855 [Bacteroidales bacterium]|nr:hypothetical protein [Bacteroidales bacterium]